MGLNVENIRKSFKEFDLEKAKRTGIYMDTPTNRGLHRVGQKYSKDDDEEMGDILFGGQKEEDIKQFKTKKKGESSATNKEPLDKKGRKKTKHDERQSREMGQAESIAKHKKERLAKESGREGDNPPVNKPIDKESKIEDTGKSTLKDIKKQLNDAPTGSVAKGGGYGPYVKTGENSWKSKASGDLSHSSRLSNHIGGYKDFRIESPEEVKKQESIIPFKETPEGKEWQGFMDEYDATDDVHHLPTKWMKQERIKEEMRKFKSKMLSASDEVKASWRDHVRKQGSGYASYFLRG